MATTEQLAQDANQQTNQQSREGTRATIGQGHGQLAQPGHLHAPVHVTEHTSSEGITSLEPRPAANSNERPSRDITSMRGHHATNHEVQRTQGQATPEEGFNQGGPSGLHRADIVSVEAVNRTMTKYVSSNNESGDSRAAVATVSRSNSGLDAHNYQYQQPQNNVAPPYGKPYQGGYQQYGYNEPYEHYGQRPPSQAGYQQYGNMAHRPPTYNMGPIQGYAMGPYHPHLHDNMQARPMCSGTLYAPQGVHPYTMPPPPSQGVRHARVGRGHGSSSRRGGLARENVGRRVVYIGNLVGNLRDDHLFYAFQHFGPILSSQIIRDNATGMSRGFAFIEYEHHDSAARVISAWNDKPTSFADPGTGKWRVNWSKKEERQMPQPSAA